MIGYIRDKLKSRKFKKSLENYKPPVDSDDRYRADVFSINAFFTSFVDYEHSGEFRKFNIGEHDYHDLLYFGLATDGCISYQGIQTKNLYRLVEFITDNNLWPEQVKLNPISDEIEKYPTFACVVEALDACEYKDPEIVLALNTYPLIYLAIAYTAVGEVGLEKLTNTQPVLTGRLAMKKILDIAYKKPARIMLWIRRCVLVLSILLIGGYCISYVVDALDKTEEVKNQSKLQM